MNKENLANALGVALIASALAVLAVFAARALRLSPAAVLSTAERARTVEDPVKAIKRAKSWEEKRKLIMQEFDRVWSEVKQNKSDEIKNASPEETNIILTPIVVDKVAKGLGVTEEEIFTAIRESE